MLVGFPDARSQGFADAEANADGDTNDQAKDGNLNRDPRPPTKPREALARPIVDLGGAGLLFPMILARPYAAVGVQAGR